VSVTDQIDRVAWALERATGERWLDYTGLRIKHHLDANDEELLVLTVSKMGDMGSWARGDTALYFTRKLQAAARRAGWKAKYLGERITQMMEDLSGMFGIEYQTLVNERATCGTWAYEDRMNGKVVGYGHHAVISSAWDRHTRREFLLMAEENEWTKGQLLSHIRGRRSAISGSYRQESSEVEDSPTGVDFWRSHGLNCIEDSPDCWRIKGSYGEQVIRAVLEGGRAVLVREA
jgi:hypothetical protein